MSSTASFSSSSITLRILHINDVYELDNFPKVTSAFRAKRSLPVASGSQLPTSTLGLLAGDFLSPSILSSIDKGYSMIDVLNRTGIDYCCIGNHEGDIDFRQFCLRVKESKFTWINSNIPDLAVLDPDAFSKDKVPEYVIIDLVSEDKTHTRRVALIGLCCDDKSVFIPNPFQGAVIKNPNSVAVQLYKKLIETEKVDLIIPMTHQLIEQDRELASMKLFPLILGGHEHEQFFEQIDNCTIIKTGSEANSFSCCDFTWDSPTAALRLDAAIEEVKDYPVDANVESVVNSHKQILNEMKSTALFTLREDTELSSLNCRTEICTMGEFMCNTIKTELQVDCALIVAGSIRGRRHYKGEPAFTYGHLKTELPFDTRVVVVELPGSVVCDSIQYSRSFGIQTPPIELGAFMQTDSKVVWDRSLNKVLEINGQPVDMVKIYRCAVEFQVLNGMDDIRPLIQFKASKPVGDRSGIHKTDESSIRVKHIVISHYCKNLFISLLRDCGGFDSIDVNGDGFITKEELVNSINASEKNNKTSFFSNTCINNLFNVVDCKNEGKISKEECLSLSMESFPLAERYSSTDSRKAIADAVDRLGPGFESEALQSDVIVGIDTDGNGEISVKEYREFVEDRAKKRKINI